jgi:glucosamine--fructose-6-phosphate aminotransferase (isomerizing)
VCGIVGYAGRERCVEVLMEGLGHLEYRGYDSAGLALQREGQIERITEVGQLENLTRALAGRNGDLSQVRTGLGHTRWATHGRPSEENAHPHLGGDGSVAVVHNGIIENCSELKEELEGRGVVFRSETDTEVMAHLIAERVEAGETLRIALAGVFQRLEGSFAVAAISVGEPGKVVAARHQSPLVIGLGEGETFLASAVQALLGETHEFLVVENGEIVEIAGSSVEVFTSSGEPGERESFEVDWDAEAAVELGGYDHYMLKEIHEQPSALGATLLGRIDSDGVVDLSDVGLDLSEIDRVVVIACGTAYHAGLLGKHAIEKLARIPVEVVIASEYRYANPIADSRTLVVAISQSGETTDTLAAVQAARSVGARVLAVTNTRGSLITREADAVLLTRAGPEICVASTKTFVAQVAALDLLALAVADIRGIIPERELREIGRGLRLAPEKVEETLGLLGDRVEEAVEVFEEARCSLFLGRGISYPVALEGALKLKEISYLPSEGYPAGEMKHGPIALVDEHCPVIAVLGEGLIREKILSNVEETIARGASVIAVAREGDKGAGRMARLVLPVPEAPEILAPFICSVPLQLLAYHVAKARGLDVDKPRNLAKSVTVE